MHHLIEDIENTLVTALRDVEAEVAARRLRDTEDIARCQDQAALHCVFAGELLEVRSRLHEVREKIVRFTHEMWNSETGEVFESRRISRSSRGWADGIRYNARETSQTHQSRFQRPG